MAKQEHVKVAAAILYSGGMEVKDVANIVEAHITTVYGWLRSKGVILRTTPNWSKYRRAAHRRNVAEQQVKYFQEQRQMGLL